MANLRNPDGSPTDEARKKHADHLRLYADAIESGWLNLVDVTDRTFALPDGETEDGWRKLKGGPTYVNIILESDPLS